METNSNSNEKDLNIDQGNASQLRIWEKPILYKQNWSETLNGATVKDRENDAKKLPPS